MEKIAHHFVGSKTDSQHECWSRRTRQDGNPPQSPRLLCSASRHQERKPSVRPGPKSNEDLGLIRPPKTNFSSENDQSGSATWPNRLRTGTFFVPSGATPSRLAAIAMERTTWCPRPAGPLHPPANKEERRGERGGRRVWKMEH